LVSAGRRPWGHSYKQLWNDLPPDVRARVLVVARDRMPELADLTDVDKLMAAYERVFKKARYYYELYEGRTLAEQHKAGVEWVERGARLDDADIAYYPQELTCLTEGLIAYLDTALGP
jgi:hypothetical protein